VNTHRFGFNGKEKDDEVSGNGNSYDYGFRIYNPRIAKFLSVDPLTKNYPWYTPYQFAGNKPIWAIDVDGLEEYIYQYTLVDDEVTFIGKITNSQIKAITDGRNSILGFQVMDKRTGKPMDPTEIGMAQYQYFDADGGRLYARRSVEGQIGPGENPMMEDWTGNFLGSVYIGPNNPPEFEGRDDYRREPQDAADAIAMQHDIDFDNAIPGGLHGWEGSKSDLSTPANYDARNSANAILKSGTDNVTGKSITDGTRVRLTLLKSFGLLEFYKKSTKTAKSITRTLKTVETKNPVMGAGS